MSRRNGGTKEGGKEGRKEERMRVSGTPGRPCFVTSLGNQYGRNAWI